MSTAEPRSFPRHAPDIRQHVVGQWATRCFGAGIADHQRLRERVLRVLEEAVELAQSEGISQEEAERLVTYVFGRPVGDPVQELGGVRVTLLAYAEEKGVSADDAERTEIERVLAKSPDDFRRRNREKCAAGVGFYTA